MPRQKVCVIKSSTTKRNVQSKSSSMKDKRCESLFFKPNAYLANAIDLVDEMVKSGDERWVDATFRQRLEAGHKVQSTMRISWCISWALNMVNLGASLSAVSQWAKRNQGGALKSDGVKTHEMDNMYDMKPHTANYQEQFWSQVDEEDADGDWTADDSKPPAKNRDLVKSVPVENFKRPVRRELPPDFDPEQAFPDTLYFKDAELGKNEHHAECTRKNAVNAHNIDTLGRSSAARFPTDQVIMNLVKNTRAEAYGNDKIAAVELVYGSKPLNQCFMISNTTWSDDKGKQRVMIFALPAGLAALRNKRLNLNFTQEAYDIMFHQIKVAVGKRWTSRALFIADFEDAIINSVKAAFPDIEFHYSCWFHFKQALRDNMVALGMTSEFIKEFLKLFDFLTVLDRDLIVGKGVAYVRSKGKLKGLQGLQGGG
ncbi:hypothetical protein ACHAWO_001289 [Cyclotella atomus]|uniref:MULE transposase domain-containing protein n=1 Tax=Cyclotella atomus TaxID=382360 RepID=A0ABD3P1P4_9STRA